MKHLEITVTGSAEAQSLKALALHAGASVIDLNNLSLALTIPENTQAVLIDDLVDFDTIAKVHTINHTFDCKVLLNASLTLSSKIVPLDLTQEDENQQKIIAVSDDALINKKITVNLLGQGARADVLCTALNGGKRHVKYSTMQNHAIGETWSNIMIKGIMDDASRLTCTSMIKVAKDAHKSHAEQANKNILLSGHARAVSIPQLEIEANDVKCKHGAAVSKFDTEHLFYMQSRGIAPERAHKMLIAGFLEA